jgi:putative endopeptidase
LVSFYIFKAQNQTGFMKKTSFSLILFLAALILAIACNAPDQSSASKFLDTSAMDSSVKPGDNFYLFVNGRWLKNAVIPSTESGIGVFNDLYNRTQDNLRALLDSVSKASNPPGSIEQKVGDFYASGMDSVTIEKRGFEPLKPYLEQIASLKNSADVLSYVINLQKENANILFGVSVGSDDKNSAMNIVVFSQGGLGLPDRDYYFKKDTGSLAVIKAYQVYIQKLFSLTGEDPTNATKKMWQVYNLEKEIATSHKSNVELRDPQSNYHKMLVATLDKEMPVFAWKTTVDALDLHTDSVNIQQPRFYEKLNELLKKTPMDTWKAYLQFHTIDGNAIAMSKDFADASFDYYNKALSGQQTIKPRWFRMVSSTDSHLGEALGQIYVKKYFTEAAKQRMLDLVNNLQTAFDTRIGNLDWMSDSTKVKAKDKLHAFLKKIGYPEKWRDYSKVSIDRNKYFENRISCDKNQFQFYAAKVGKPVDRMEWGMTPPTINAYYNAANNEIVFPAGILQYPFFDLRGDDAVNYGAIGMFIGHEMTHGFDDQGAQYDKDGNLKNWWSKSDSVKFVAKTKLIIDQYNGFVAIDTFHVNGSLTTGENIADLGGITIAYDAFKLTQEGRDSSKIDGLSPDQRFFLAYGQAWRSKYKEELRRQLLSIDSHSPDMYRVLGPLENFTPFYKTFGVKEGDRMYKPDSTRIKIW